MAGPIRWTSKAIVVAGNAAVRHIQFDVVIGLTNPRRRRLQARAKHRPNAIIHVDTPYMPELMARSDRPLGAGGTTTWERMFMGRPSIVVSADNQFETCEWLAKLGDPVPRGPVFLTPPPKRAAASFKELQTVGRPKVRILVDNGRGELTASAMR
jgi:UDP-2,4-diacetamido-2,4,6-trideoxy-beta-L-altropyranose hydrolase